MVGLSACNGLDRAGVENRRLPIVLSMQLENLVKFPFCVWRVGSGKWINDVTEGGTV